MAGSDRLNIALHGFGKMGQMVSRIAHADKNVTIVSTIDRQNPKAKHKEITEASLAGVDVLIDFSQKDAVRALIQSISKINPKIRIVVGTTGWENELNTIKKEVMGKKLYFLHSPNFAIGVNLFFRLVAYATDLTEAFSPSYQFDPAVFDVHHRGKADMPSGTAKRLAQIIIKTSKTKRSPLYGIEDRPIAPHELHVAAIRAGSNVGYHEIVFDTDGETITLSHQSKDRAIFARGALLAAFWLAKQKKPGVYTFDDFIQKHIVK